jgi:hypothetical protein
MVYLHGHVVPLPRRSVEEIASSLQQVAKMISLNNFRENTSRFAQLLDECWGVRTIELRQNAPQVKGQFLVQLCRVLSNHVDFWDASGRVFFVVADLRHKLAQFPLNDPHVQGLSSGNGAAAKILYELIVKHSNSGKRSGRLQLREEPEA